MNIASLDLNLLKVFDALARLGSVSASAEELSLSQPAVSNALRRLREATGDELFVRTRRGMEPTAFAQSLREAIAQGLSTIRAGFERGAIFAPAASQRRFRLSMTDIGEVVILPRLMALLRERAPQVTLSINPTPFERWREALDSDVVDAAIGNLHPPGGPLAMRTLFEETFVILCRRGHPWVAAPPSEAAYRAARSVVVSPPSGPLNDAGRAESHPLFAVRPTLVVPHYMVLAPIIEQGDLVAVVPSRVARALQRHHPLEIAALPMESPIVAVNIVWHLRQQKDEGRRWLHALIDEALDAAQPA